VFPETVRFGPSVLTAVFTKVDSAGRGRTSVAIARALDRLMSEDGQSTTEGSMPIETAVGRLRLEALPDPGATLTYYRKMGTRR
jgi:hypothetical protein